MTLNHFIDSYKVHHLIEKGGQANVYCASKDGSLYAIKVYNQNTDIFLQQFRRQKQIYQKIQHQGILNCLEIRQNVVTHISQKGQQFKNLIIMPFLQNGDLMNEIINFGHFSEQMTRKISIKIIASISYLKKEDLLHCDIKPENILLDTNYNPLLIDFGYSQFFRENFNQQITHPYYIAPQIKKAKQPVHTQKSQMFSFGVLLFLTHIGIAPFQATRHTDNIYRFLLQGKNNKFWNYFEQKTNRKFNKQFKDMMNHLLETNPAKRYSINDFLTCEWMSIQQISQQSYFRQFQKRKNRLKQQLEQETTTAIKQKLSQRANSFLL